MKKIFLLLLTLGISIIGFSQVKLDVIKDGLKVGRTFPKNIVANELKTLDGIDTTKTIQAQLNAKVSLEDSVAGYTAAEVDSIVALKASISDVYTKVQDDAFRLNNKLQFIVAATGTPPINGDSILVNSYLKNKQVEVVVNGLRLYENYTATNGKLGYRFNSTTGIIVFRPVLATGNIVQVNIIGNTITAIGLEQNLFKYSEDLTNAAWNTNGTIEANQKADLSGNMTLEKITVTSGNLLKYYNGGTTQFPVTPNTTYTISFDFDPGTLTTAVCRILDSDANPFYVSDVSIMNQATAGIVRRVALSFTTDGTTATIDIYPLRNTPAGYFYIGRMQLAKSTTANYVTTTTTATP